MSISDDLKAAAALRVILARVNRLRDYPRLKAPVEAIDKKNAAMKVRHHKNSLEFFDIQQAHYRANAALEKAGIDFAAQDQAFYAKWIPIRNADQAEHDKADKERSEAAKPLNAVAVDLSPLREEVAEHLPDVVHGPDPLRVLAVPKIGEVVVLTLGQAPPPLDQKRFMVELDMIRDAAEVRLAALEAHTNKVSMPPLAQAEAAPPIEGPRIILDTTDMAILRTLESDVALTQPEIAKKAKVGGRAISKETVENHTPKLVAAGLIEKVGPKKGFIITDAGLARLKRR